MWVSGDQVVYEKKKREPTRLPFLCCPLCELQLGQILAQQSRGFTYRALDYTGPQEDFSPPSAFSSILQSTEASARVQRGIQCVLWSTGEEKCWNGRNYYMHETLQQIMLSYEIKFEILWIEGIFPNGIPHLWLIWEGEGMQDLQNPSILIIQWLRKIIHIFWLALRLVHEVKCAKQANACLTHGLDFACFNFSLLGSLGLVVKNILTRVS